MKKIIHTTAEQAYDWGQTTELVANVGTSRNGKTIRKVEIDGSEYQVEAQCARYSSGCHMVADDAEWAKLVEYKLVTLA